MRRLLPLFLLAAACSKSAPAPAPAGSAATLPQPVSETPPQPKPEQPAPAKKPAAPIKVTLKNLQIFHPHAQSRALPSVKEEASFDSGNTEYGAPPSRFGVGMVVEAENTGEELLADADFRAELVLKGKNGEMACELAASKIGYDGPKYLTLTKAEWKNDAEQELEAAWRPKERIRMYGRNERCDTLVLADLDPEKIHASVKVIAHKRFPSAAPRLEIDDTQYDMTLDASVLRIVDKKSKRVFLLSGGSVAEMEAAEAPKLKRVRFARAVYLNDDKVESAPLEVPVHPRALSVQTVKLSSGELGYVAGNIVVHAKDGAPVFEDLARLGFSVDTMPRGDVPDQPSPINVGAEELAAQTTAFTIASAAEDPTIEKGKRRVTVKWNFGIAGAQIATRLGDKANERTVKAERARVAKLIPCDGIQLVTTKTKRDAANKGDAAKACGGLDLIDGTEVTLTYDVDRYEIPVGLAYSVAGKKTFSPIASIALLKLDPR